MGWSNVSEWKSSALPECNPFPAPTWQLKGSSAPFWPLVHKTCAWCSDTHAAKHPYIK